MQNVADTGPNEDDSPLEIPSYEQIVQMLTFLVDVVDVKAGVSEDRALHALHTSLQASLDAALRVEWASKPIDDDGEVVFLD